MKYCYVRYYLDEDTHQIEKKEIEDISAITDVEIEENAEYGFENSWRLAIELPNGHFVLLGDLPQNENDFCSIGDFDFYSIQTHYDWFGDNTAVEANFRTLDECIDYIIDNKLYEHNEFNTASGVAIIKQVFGAFSYYW